MNIAIISSAIDDVLARTDELDPTFFSRALAGFPFKLEIARLNVGLSIVLPLIVPSNLDAIKETISASWIMVNYVEVEL